MSEDLFKNDSDESGELHQGELEVLKNRANQLNIKFHPNIGVDALREKVNAQLTANVDTHVAKDQTAVSKRIQRKREAGKLIRCKIHCNDPAKKEWPGEYITVGNSSVGTFRKYIPYNVDEPYHLPQIILNVLREKKVQVFATKKGKNNIPIRTSKLIGAYTIEIMDPLTEAELKRLSQAQMARNSIDND